MSAVAFVPYSQVAPKTTDLRELRLELRRVREVYGPRSSQGLEAFQRLCRESFLQGQPIDQLRRHTTNEVERFFARTVQGTDGHVYWNGRRDFRRNDGALRTPARWWWEHVHGTIGSSTRRVSTTCDQPNCINPEHSKCENFNTEKRRTDEQLIGALQVAAMRLGRTPTTGDWAKEGLSPTSQIFARRFGSWGNACRAAGLDYHPVGSTPEQCVTTLRFARDYLGEWPTVWDFRSRADLKQALAEAGLPTSDNVIYKHLGPTWQESLLKAGKRAA